MKSNTKICITWFLVLKTSSTSVVLGPSCFVLSCLWPSRAALARLGIVLGTSWVALLVPRGFPLRVFLLFLRRCFLRSSHPFIGACPFITVSYVIYFRYCILRFLFLPIFLLFLDFFISVFLFAIIISDPYPTFMSFSVRIRLNHTRQPLPPLKKATYAKPANRNCRIQRHKHQQDLVTYINNAYHQNL